MNRIAILIGMICLISNFQGNSQAVANKATPVSASIEKIKVLNFATFHMRATSDANSVEFDTEDQGNQSEAKAIAQMISKFKPTIICVEIPPEKNADLNVEYQKYIRNSEESSSYDGEVRLLAFEIGKIANVEKLYGIDHKMEYNYNIRNEMTNNLDANTINDFYGNPLKYYPELGINQNELPLIDRLKMGNTPKCFELLMAINADLLTHVGSKDGFEGADEAAKYYQRNLRIYSNLNRVPATKDDRILILYGGSHTAFLNEFIKRSPKYEVVNTMDYLD